jgi:hypothetical protein
MNNNISKYGLRYKKTGDMIYYYTENNEEGYPSSHYLTHKENKGKELWLVDDPKLAVMARWVSEDWYNASYDTPVNPYHAKDLEVVQVVTMVVPIEYPNLENQLEYVNTRLQEGGWSKLSDKYMEEVKKVEESEI